MTCASCVNRIERFLNGADGVADATVNLATERATVRYDPGVIDRTGIVAAIEAAGYDVAARARRARRPEATPTPPNGESCSSRPWLRWASVWRW